MFLIINAILDAIGGFIFKLFVAAIIIITIARILAGTGISAKSVYETAKDGAVKVYNTVDTDKIINESERVTRGLYKQTKDAATQIIYGE